MKLTGAAILVSRGMKGLAEAPAAYPWRSAAWLGSGFSMSEAEALSRLERFGLELDGPTSEMQRYAVIDPQPPGQLTFFWRQGGTWVWQPILVVPGPGRLLRFTAVEKMVDAILDQYARCR